MREALPAPPDPFAPALAAALENAIRSRLDSFVASENFQRLWVEANRRAHTRIVALLTTGQSAGCCWTATPSISTWGRWSTACARPAGARARPAGGRDPVVRRRPRDAGEVRGPRQGAQGVDLIERLTIVLPILALLCLGGYVFLSRPRRRGLLRVGLGLIVTALL